MTDATAVSDTSWKAQGACSGTSSRVFFETDSGVRAFDPEPAKRICSDCSVRMACLWFAIANNEEFGVWGGATTLERHKIVRDWRDGRRPGANAPSALVTPASSK